MPIVDHLVYAVPDLDAGVAAIEAQTGVRSVAGGSHPGAGTRNALLSFDDHTYFEIISVDSDQPDHQGPRPFGVEVGKPPRMASFAMHPADGETIESLADRMRELGFDPGPVTSMSRRRPDGVEISWRLTRATAASLGNADPAVDGVIPFVIDWGDTTTPARSTPRLGRLRKLQISHPDAGLVALLDELDIRLGEGVVEAQVGDRRLTATVELADGRVIELS